MIDLVLVSLLIQLFIFNLQLLSDFALVKIPTLLCSCWFGGCRTIVSFGAPLLTYAVTIASFVLTTQQYTWTGKAPSVNHLLLIIELMEKRIQPQVSTAK